MSELNSLDSGKVVTKGNSKASRVSDPNAIQLLSEILIELRIINTYNSLGHDEDIKEEGINEN